MDIGLYIIIFGSKVIENALATLRLIVVAHGKKGFGAFLQLIVALVWVLVTGSVLVGIASDPFRVVAFVLGSYVGSYVGSIMEEKMALGSNMLMAIVDRDLSDKVVESLRKKKFAVTSFEAQGKEKIRAILMIMVSRRSRDKVVDIIKEEDNNSMIIAENASTIYGGYDHDMHLKRLP